MCAVARNNARMKNETKRAKPDHPILPILAERYSPYAFEPKPVEKQKLLSCLEAARWAASSFNEQPWVFLIAERENTAEFEKMLGCLMEANQAWAKHTGVLILTATKRTFTRNDNPNRVCEHDVALAVANLTVQATHEGLAVHQMAGVNLSKARQVYNVPDTHDIVTAVAIGYATTPEHAATEELGKRDAGPRTRKALSEFVFTGTWKNTSPVVK